MSWRTLNEKEVEIIDKMAVRGFKKECGFTPTQEELDFSRGIYMVHYSRQGSFTTCQILRIDEDGSLWIAAGPSRRSKEDKKRENSELGEILAFRRAYDAECVRVERAPRKEPSKPPKGFLRLYSPDGSMHDTFPGNIRCSWFPNDKEGPRSLVWITGDRVYYDYRHPDEIYAANEAALRERGIK